MIKWQKLLRFSDISKTAGVGARAMCQQTEEKVVQ